MARRSDPSRAPWPRCAGTTAGTTFGTPESSTFTDATAVDGAVFGCATGFVCPMTCAAAGLDASAAVLRVLGALDQTQLLQPEDLAAHRGLVDPEVFDEIRRACRCGL